MKKRTGQILPAVIISAEILIAIAIGLVYFDFISKQIFRDSTDHLGEIYGQVNRSFGGFVQRNWSLLNSWERALSLSASEEEGAAYLAEEQSVWHFSAFYFVGPDGSCITPDGQDGKVDLSQVNQRLSNLAEPVLVGGTLPNGQEVTVFAVPVEPGVFRRFTYEAVAVSYTNADLAASLNVDAFSGKAKCFVIGQDGSVLLSTQSGGSVFNNYLQYLRAASDLDSGALEALRSAWQAGETGLLQCEIGGVSTCILYQPVGYQDYLLLSAVPQNVVSAGFLSVQKVTMGVLIVIFLLLGAAVVSLILLLGHNKFMKNRTELQYRELMFDVLSSSVDDIFIMLDTQRESVDYISPNVERLLGIPAQEARDNIRVLEKCAVNFNVVIPRDTLQAIPLGGNRHWECEYMHQTTGERRWYRMTVYNMMLQDVRKYIVVMSDRTQDRQLNQKLQEALTAAKSANEAKSNFLSNMSHDIRTPMNAIVGFSMLLEKDADQPEKVREYVRKITASSHHLLSLINDVLDMSKIESGKTSLNVDKFSLPELLEELQIILMPQAKAKGQSFEVSVQGAPPEQLTGDKLRLNQILINLLSNAVKYTPDGGRIEFLVSELPQSTPQFAKLRFTVRDNGIGMSEEFQKQVFAPFSREISSVTNKIQGTGLGMAITKNLVDLMGGIIQVQSQPGQGSVFTVELSFALPEPEEGDVWYRQKITRLLVTDDEEEICRDIREMLRGSGAEVTTAVGGAAAIEAVKQAHSRGEDYDAILLDWKMPGMDGPETARRIRQVIGRQTPILVLSSYDWDREDEADARRAGIDAFMAKPFFPSTFWQTLKPLVASEYKVEETAAGQETEGVMAGRLFLVAEDNALNAEIISEVLEIEGARCELASNGAEALEMFRNAAPGHYDMILMDVQMPVMNGYEATRQIRACEHPEAKTIPIVAMTANTFAEDVRDAMDAGMNGHLGKPLDMDAVQAMVGKLLPERPPREP